MFHSEELTKQAQDIEEKMVGMNAQVLGINARKTWRYMEMQKELSEIDLDIKDHLRLLLQQELDAMETARKEITAKLYHHCKKLDIIYYKLEKLDVKGITQEYLKECLDYDEGTGKFTWRKRPLHHFSEQRNCTAFNNQYSGKVAGSIIRKGKTASWAVYIGNQRLSGHRLAWLYVHGEWSDDVAHFSENRLDNRISNLCDPAFG